jgi:hypothetical protein
MTLSDRIDRFAETTLGSPPVHRELTGRHRVGRRPGMWSAAYLLGSQRPAAVTWPRLRTGETGVGR